MTAEHGSKVLTEHCDSEMSTAHRECFDTELLLINRVSGGSQWIWRVLVTTGSMPGSERGKIAPFFLLDDWPSRTGGARISWMVHSRQNITEAVRIMLDVLINLAGHVG
jgi:hypothetical protein